MVPKIKFNNGNTLFSQSLKKRINNFFHQKEQAKSGNRKLFLKGGILLSSLVIIYLVLLFLNPAWYISIPLCIILGVNFAAIGFNIMHDAGHDSFCENKNSNSILSYSLNLLGGNIYLWKLKHNIAHHTYTNIDGNDHDIEVKFMRIHKDQPVKGYHRFQPVYFILLYSISYLAWIFYQDYEKYFRQKLSKDSPNIKFPMRERVIFWISKAIHFSIFILIPVLVVGWLPTLIGLLIAGLTCGVCLAVVFQLAHVVTGTEFKTIEDYTVEEEWMIHQLQSTANFATKSKVLTWLLGGLNFQVEHHLFPKISHIHYPEINKIVKETCKEFNITYNEFRTMTDAFKSHVQVIKLMSV